MVLYFPINFNAMPNERTTNDNHLIWPHRWEHGKHPQLLANILIELDRRQILFTLSEQFYTYPNCLDKINEKLIHKLRHFGYLSRWFEIRFEKNFQRFT